MSSNKHTGGSGLKMSLVGGGYTLKSVGNKHTIKIHYNFDNSEKIITLPWVFVKVKW